MTTLYRLPRQIIAQTFEHLRECGRGRHECQILWLSSWDSPEAINEMVHPRHKGHMGGFILDDAWLNGFWLRLGREKIGIRVQIHTHPAEAFHSQTDDEFPIIHTPGFLSLVIPDFALGPVGFERAYLTEIQANGRWQRVPNMHRFAVE